MKCPNCKKEISSTASFCPECGEPLKNKKPGKNNKNKIIVVLVILLTIILAAAAGMASFIFNGGTKPLSTPSPEPIAPSPTPTPEAMPTSFYATPEPTVSAEVKKTEKPKNLLNEVLYKTYSDGTYNFSCKYPSDFVVYNDGVDSSRYTVEDPRGSGYQKICAKRRNGETVSSVMNEFISSIGGLVIYQSDGDDYFAARVQKDDKLYYRYCKFKNNNIYWFDYVFSEANYDLYETYINDTYDSFYIE